MIKAFDNTSHTSPTNQVDNGKPQCRKAMSRMLGLKYPTPSKVIGVIKPRRITGD